MTKKAKQKNSESGDTLVGAVREVTSNMKSMLKARKPGWYSYRLYRINGYPIAVTLQSK